MDSSGRGRGGSSARGRGRGSSQGRGGDRGRGGHQRPRDQGDYYQERPRRDDGQSRNIDRPQHSGGYSDGGRGRGSSRGHDRGRGRGGHGGFDGGRSGNVDRPQQPRDQQQPRYDRGQFRSSSGDGGQHLKGAYVRDITVPKSDVICGTKGRKIIVEANYLPFNFGDVQKLKCFHYDVTIEPARFKKLFSKIMEKFRQEHYGDSYPVFDGVKNLYSSKLISESEYCGEVVLTSSGSSDSKPFTFNVKLKYVKQVDMSPLYNYKECDSIKTIQEACQFLSVILRASPFLSSINFGRNFYTPEQKVNLTGGMDMYYGIHQAPILAQRGPMVNVNIVHKAFISAKNVLELIKDILDIRDLPDCMNRYQTEEVLNIIEGKRVEYIVHGLKRDYTINGFRGSAINEKIPSENKSVKDYYAEKKNYTIKNVKFQLLWVGDKKKDPPILIPAELCAIKPGQVPRKAENSQVVSNIIKVAATSTTVRKNRIMEQRRVADYENSPYLKEFGFSVGDEFEKVEARVLDPPKLKYMNDNALPDKGVWNIRGKKFLSSTRIGKWVIVNLDSYVTIQRIKNLEKVFIDQAKYLGIEMVPPDAPINLNPKERQFESKLRTTFEGKKDGYLIIVVFSDRTDKTAYQTIKQQAELNVGCLTQCILSKTINRENVPGNVISNILLKVNAKLNGVNHQLAERPPFLKGNIMVMGADVTHPKSGTEDKASFAAVTASHDHDFFKYNIICQLQPPTKEVITNLQAIVNQQLRTFYRNTGTKPDHIIFLRDGVSEGQFDDVKKFEIGAIRAACNNIQKDGQYKPLITFLTVLKRHHTRFFPTNPADSYDRNGNIPAGTCVDTGIVHPVGLNLKHFFLASHTAIQGVTKPAKYCTLHDDANLSYDDVEQLCYYLCHMYCRCTRAVSYPAPTYYAHLAAERAKNLYKNKIINWDELEKHGRIIVETKMEKSPMFFV